MGPSLLRRGRRVAALSSVLLAAATPAAAQSIEGAVRLGADVGVFEYESSSVSTDGSSLDTEVTNISFGVVPSSFGFDLGFGASDHLVLGLRTTLAIQNTEVSTGGSSSLFGSSDSSSASQTTVQLLPYVEGVFSSGKPTRVFVGGTMGLIAASTGGDALDTSQTSFAIGALFGAHHFFGAAASFDPSLYLLYYTGSGDTTSDTAGDGPSINVSGFVFGILLGVSVWPGAAAPASEPEPTEAAPSFGTGYDPTAYSGQPPPRPRPRRPSGPPLLSENTVIDGVRIYFLGQPEINPTHAALRFSRYSSTPQLANCKQLVLTIDGVAETHALQYKPRYSGAAVEELSQAQVELAVIERIANAQSVTADLCGLTRTFDQRATSRARVFLGRFRQKAAATSAPPAGAPAPAPGGAPAPGAAPPAPVPGGAPAPAPGGAPPPAPGAGPAPAPGASPTPPAPGAAPAPPPAPAR